MRILAQVQRPIDVMNVSIIANRLRDGQNMRLIKGPAQGRPAMSARSKAHPLIRVPEIRSPRVILPFEPGQIHQHFLGSRFACQRRSCHIHSRFSNWNINMVNPLSKTTLGGIKKSRRYKIPRFRDLLASAYSLTGRPAFGRITLYLVIR